MSDRGMRYETEETGGVERTPGPIPKLVHVLQSEVDELHAAIDGLLAAVDYGMRPSRPTPTEPGENESAEAKRDQRSQLFEQVDRITGQVRALTGRVRRHIDRVDL